MADIYNYLEDIMPIKRVLISLAIGMVSLFIVLASGLTSDFVREETVASRTFSAFCFTGLASFIFMMCCEEYAIFKTKRELENFIDSAQIAETGEEFNRKEYLHEEDEVAEVEEVEEITEVTEPIETDKEVAVEEETEAAFRPMNFNNLQSQ